MSKTLRTLGFAALFAVSASALMSSQASALSMTECSAKYKAAKAAGTDGGLKWNDFRKANCAADAAAVAPAAPAAPAAAAAKPAKAVVAAPAAPAAAAAAAPAGGTFMQQCSAAWKAMKAANTVPAGMTFRDFQKGKCVAPAGAMAAAPAAPATPVAAAPMKPIKVAPAEPVGTAADTSAEATVDKNGKPLTAKQIAAHVRIKQCGNNWRADKAANKIAAGQTWPKYWHECSMKLKAAGQ